MTSTAGLAALAPQQRAALIYGAARAAAADRLWQAALGTPDDEGKDDARSFPGFPRLPSSRASSPLEDLLTQLAVDGAARPAGPVALASAAPTAIPAAKFAEAGGAVSGLGANARYGAALTDAATRTGIPAPALAAIVDAEAAKGRDGSWQTLSRNPRSSAAGLGQFLSRTWEGLAETPGTWLNGHARANGWLDGGGRVTAASRAAVLSLRYDPDASINSIADYARRNLDGLKHAGVTQERDLEGTARLAYLGHHLGLGDTIRFVRDGTLAEGRARTLLTAQVGAQRSDRRIAVTGSAAAAHRDWLLEYLDRKIDVTRFRA